MNSENIQDIYPLSPMQQGMLFHTVYSPESGAYTEQTHLELRGPLNVAAFEQAWRAVVDRNPILRTAFVWEGVEEPLQVVFNAVEFRVQVDDWRSKANAEQELEGVLNADRAAGFVLTEAPLMRIKLLRTGDESYVMIWTHHHLLLDGWSQPLLMQELFALYQAYDQGKAPALPERPPFKNYIDWLQEQDAAAAEAHWKNVLKNFTAPTPLPTLRALNDPATADYMTAQTMLPEEISDALREFCQKNGLTLNTLVQGVWALLLNRYSGEQDVVFGAVVSGRPPELPGAEQMLGLFINTLPVRAFVDSNRAVLDWLKALQAQQAAGRRFEYSSLVQIKSAIKFPGDLPLFETIVVFESYPVDESLTDDRRAVRLGEQHHFSRTNFPLTFVCSPGRQIGFEIAFESERFSAESVQSMLGHVQTLLTAMTTQPQARLGLLPMITEAEQHQLIDEWNDTTQPYPQEMTLHALFEQRAKERPDHPALFFQGRTLTYRELNERANRLGRFLVKKGVGVESPVAVCVERSFDMIVALLATLKAGGACVPIDPIYPDERIQLMIEDSQPAVMLTQKKQSERFEKKSAPVILLDEDAGWANENADNLNVTVLPDHLAYVIFTSGSTGRPKGTLVPHRGVVNFIEFGGKDFATDGNARVLQFASFSFDAAMGEIFKALLVGGTLYLAPREVLLSADDLQQLITEQQINWATLAPSVLAQLNERKLPTLQKLASVGEACSWELVRRWAPGRTFVNGYGPTETSIGAASGRLESRDVAVAAPPIGRPSQNIFIYILDPDLNPVPIGVVGQIFIGGVGVARGYLNRADLTADRFVPNPFHGDGARMYKTGDLGRYLPDGRIAYEGRCDFQVKLRGFRIELGEIEAQLEALPQVKQAVVVVRQDHGEKQLVAYAAPQDGQSVDAQQLSAALREKLPDYMAPSAFVVLETFPLTPNGKVDRKALPAPDGDSYVTAEYAAPRTPGQELIAGLFQDILKRDRVSIYDNFFHLGGHSLLATQLLSRLRDAYQIDLPMQLVFSSPTVAELAAQVDAAKAQDVGMALPPLQPTARDGDLPLSFAQQRLWFLDQLEPNSPFYNIPIALRLRGILNVEALQKSLNALVERHESLRTCFQTVGGQPRQQIADGLQVVIEQIDLAALAEKEREAEVQTIAEQEALQPFALDQAPLFRVKLLILGKQDAVFLLTLHHIIGDGWSINIIVRETAQLYRTFVKGETPSLPALPIQYPDFARWQRQVLQGEYLRKQLDFWRNQLAGCPPLLELPTDFPRPRVQSFNGATVTRTLPVELSRAVAAFSRKEGVTLFMTLLAAYGAVLSRYAHQNDLAVGTPIANRNRLEMENLIGFFVNNLVLRCRFDDNPSFIELVQQIRKTALDAYAHQDIPFELLVEELHPHRDLSHSPLFQVVFVMQNTPMGGLNLPELVIEPVVTESRTAKFDLSLEAAESADGLIFSLEYNTDLFRADTAERLLLHLELFLRNALLEPEAPTAQIELLPEGEERRLLVEWNRSDAEFARDRCAHQVFESWVKKQPQAVAASYNGTELTYDELNRRANRLAYWLRQQGVGPDSLVAISVRRSLEQAVAMLAVLKAGGAFVPVDPTYPPDRIDYMLADSRAAVLLTQNALADKLRAGTVFCLDADWETLDEFSDADLPTVASPLNLAYVIYTSGSTGRPKGTMLPHLGMINLAGAQKKAFDIEPGMRILQFAPMSFDASVWETVMALLNGATLCLADQDALATGDGLLKILSEQQINVVTLPPSVLAVVPPSDLPQLKTIITAGEKCSAELVERWRNGRRYVNAYGPTETTVCASMHECDGSYPQGPPIGRPIDNAKLYILDAHLNPTPIGVAGELCVGGPSVARGYLNRPELTAEKFIPNPFARDGSRLYRTGDLVRYLPDGNIEFLGRIDFQVKVRGFRIELGEIEAALAAHPQVKNVIVLAKEVRPGDTRLVAYTVCDEPRPTSDGLRKFVGERLPDYMTPSLFIFLDDMPLTPSGKIDRRALPQPDLSRPELQVEYVEPRTETEKKLAEICRELLHIDRVGAEDNFFDLGGHSLLATQFISRLRDVFGVELPLRTLFERPTVAGLAEAVEEAKLTKPSQPVPITAVSRENRRRTIGELN